MRNNEEEGLDDRGKRKEVGEGAGVIQMYPCYC